MRFTHNHAFIAAASAIAGVAVLSGAVPYGVPDNPPENHALEDGLDAWKKQLLA